MSKEVTSEQSLVCEGVGYDEVFQIGHMPEEGLSWSSERETSAHSPDEEVESCVGEGGEEEEEIDKGEDEGDERREEGKDDGDKSEVDKRIPKVEVQEALGIGIPVHSSSPKCGPLMTLS